MHRLVIAILVTTAIIAAADGCAKKVGVHPGSISNLDSYAYDLLLVEQDVLNQAKASYAAGSLPESAVPVFNKAVAQYNVAQSAWHAYHDQHAANDSALSDALNALVGAVGELQRTLGKKISQEVTRADFIYAAA